MSKQAITQLEGGKFYGENVRIAYPTLYKAEHFKGDLKNSARYSLVILIPKTDEASYKLLKNDVDKKIKSELKLDRIPAADVSLKDGDENRNEAYHGHWYVNAYKYPKTQENLTSNPPDVVDTNKNRIREGDAKDPCSGDYCDVIFDFYAGTKWKKINAGFSVVRFRSKGDPIGGGNDVSQLKEVDELEEDGSFE